MFKPIKSDPTRVAALKSGDVDIIDRVPTADISGLRKDPKVVISEGIGNRPWFVWIDMRRDLTPYVFNNDGTPAWPNPLRDWKVRKALSLAINRQAIVDRVFEGSAVIATQLLPEGFYGYNDDLKPEPYDPARAKQLLAEAGFPDGFKVTLHSTSGRVSQRRQGGRGRHADVDPGRHQDQIGPEPQADILLPTHEEV